MKKRTMTVDINKSRNIPGRGEFMLRRKINSMAMFVPDTPLLPAGIPPVSLVKVFRCGIEVPVSLVF